MKQAPGTSLPLPFSPASLPKVSDGRPLTLGRATLSTVLWATISPDELLKGLFLLPQSRQVALLFCGASIDKKVNPVG